MKLLGITRNVIVLGWVSFLTDVASEMLYPVMPLFLVGSLGASPAVLGLIDGLAEGVSSGLRWLGGALSDRYRRRKPFVVAGYAVSAVSKPVMGLAAYALGWPLFLIGRCSDRLGKSIRTSARDALIADSTEAAYRGVAFGLHRTMDTCGAIIGPLVTVAVIALWPIAQNHLQWLFFVALLPGVASAFLCAAAVREVLPRDGKAEETGGKPPSMFQRFPGAFWHLLLANAIFSLGNSSDSFLILRSKEVGLSFTQVVLAFAVYNVVYAAAATPVGKLSDVVGRKGVVTAGWVVYAGVYIGFALVRSTAAPWWLLAAYGLYQALSEGVTKAMVSDVVAPQQRGGAIGLFYTVSGFGQLAASLIAGELWYTRVVHGRVMAAFVVGAACALMGAGVVATVRTRPATDQTGAGE